MTAHSKPEFVIAIHGGAGTILKSMMTDEKEITYRERLIASLDSGYDVLVKGGSATDAVEAAIVIMEDSPLFNAGKGAVFTHEGDNEQDACIMDGKTRNVGAVAGVKRIANPIKLARLVMDYSKHVLLSGDGAEVFAQLNGMKLVDKEYFHTDHRWNQLQLAIRREKKQQAEQIQLDHSDDRDKIGTVGAVAMDSHGNLAAATSTGGMTNKRYGRIGDSPIIGAGTFADNNTCAISATGVGEHIMRAVLAYDIAALMEYKKLSLEDAANIVVRKKLAMLEGTGGLVGVDKDGNVAMPFNSAGMYRGFRKAGEEPSVAIFED